MKTIRPFSLILLFLLITSAIAPEIKRAERQKVSAVKVIDLSQLPSVDNSYDLTREKMETEQIKMQIRIAIKEIQILMNR